MSIEFKTIPHKDQRYDTVGDYFCDGINKWQFRVSEMGNHDFEFLVFIHELVEFYLTQKRGIREEDITEFDKKFEELRSQFPNTIGDQEPGHMESAPYHKEHVFAEKIERLMAEELDVDWEAYDKVVNGL